MPPPQGIFVCWLKVNFSEVFVAWIHLKALRVFVESVLRSVLTTWMIFSHVLSTLPKRMACGVSKASHEGISCQVWITCELSGSAAADGQQALKETQRRAGLTVHAPGPHCYCQQDRCKRTNSPSVLLLLHTSSQPRSKSTTKTKQKAGRQRYPGRMLTLHLSINLWDRTVSANDLLTSCCQPYFTVFIIKEELQWLQKASRHSHTLNSALNWVADLIAHT